MLVTPLPRQSSVMNLLSAAGHKELSLQALAESPVLSAVHDIWREEVERSGRLPQRLDPLRLPRAILPYVMLLDLEEKRGGHLLRIRLAGTEVCAKHGREMKGLTTEDFFQPQDADAVTRSALEIARTRQPSLARRAYVTLGDRCWSYLRLILPLSRDGKTVDSFFKAADPVSMTEKTDWTALANSLRA